jgi:hypothetical protein
MIALGLSRSPGVPGKETGEIAIKRDRLGVEGADYLDLAANPRLGERKPDVGEPVFSR